MYVYMWACRRSFHWLKKVLVFREVEEESWKRLWDVMCGLLILLLDSDSETQSCDLCLTKFSVVSSWISYYEGKLVGFGGCGKWCEDKVFFLILSLWRCDLGLCFLVFGAGEIGYRLISAIYCPYRIKISSFPWSIKFYMFRIQKDFYGVMPEGLELFSSGRKMGSC